LKNWRNPISSKSNSPRKFARPSAQACEKDRYPKEEFMLRTILLIILLLALLGALPAWPYSTGWGYYPSGGLGLLLLIVLIFAVVDRRAAI